MQETTPYQYSAIGQLTRDFKEGVSFIEWYRGNKKIKRIVRNDLNSDEVAFEYDPFGQRILKIEKPRSNGVLSAATSWNYTYYAYDAGGKLMATYTSMLGSTAKDVTLKEQSIYGAKRIGLINVAKLIASNTNTIPAVTEISNKLGNKQYELSNHLGNVNVVINDRKMVSLSGSNYEAVVIMKADYYPFGMEMPGRTSNTPAYRFGYNGMEKDDKVNGSGNAYTTEFRQYDPRLGRWMSRDPKVFPDESPYISMGNNPIYFTDVLGDIIKGHDRASANEFLNILKHTFEGTDVAYLFKLKSDGLTLEKISAKDMANALKQITNQDLKDLAYAYYLAVNAESTHEVYFIGSGQSTLYPVEVNGEIVNNGAELNEIAGGGVNVSGTGLGSFTHISFVQNTTGVHASNIDENSEILAHELLGHGYNGDKGSATSGHEDAVQMSNLYRRKVRISIARDGSDHGTGSIIGNPFGLPSNFSGVNRFIDLNKTNTNYQHIAKGTEY